MSTLIVPSMRYRDAKRALEWLQRAFGFERHAVYENPDGRVMHAEMKFGEAFIMFGQVADTPFGKHMIQPSETGGRNTISPYVVMPEADVEAHHRRAVAAGADIVDPLTKKDYGGSGYSARDLEGFVWSFGSYDPRAPVR
ncbi:MAG: VOC family protein [Steroidobacteraceae bacterium]